MNGKCFIHSSSRRASFLFPFLQRVWQFHHLLCIFNEGDQSTHFLTALPWIHQVREYVAVEGVDTARSGPGVKGEIIGLPGSNLDCVLLDRLGQYMPIFSDDVEGMTMHMHRVHHHCIRANQPDMYGLTMLDIDGLRIREALAVDHIPAARHRPDEGCILNIGLDRLLCLGSSRARVYNEGSVEATHHLLHIIVVAVIPVGTNILIMDGEVIDIGLTRLNGFHAKTRYAVCALGHFQPVPVNPCRFGEVIDKGYTNMIASRDPDHGSWNGSIDRPGQNALPLDDL